VAPRHRPDRRRAGLLALALITAVLAPLAARHPVPPPGIFDQPFYLGIAQDLRTTGRFTDGFMFDPAPDGQRRPGMRFGPLYPAVLAAVAAADPGLRSAMACVVQAHGRAQTVPDACPRAAPVMRGAQILLTAATLWLVWWMGRVLGGAACGWVALGAGLVAAPTLLDAAFMLMTEALCLVLTTAASAAGLRALCAWRREGTGHGRVAGSRLPVAPAVLGWSGLAGAVLGLAILARPAFLYLVPALLLAGGVAACRHPATWRRAAPFAAAALAAALTVAPWVARNAVVLHRAGLTFGYASHTLVQRIAFDTMTWREYGRAFVCWLPDGNAFGRRLWGPGACDRFGWEEHPDTFYVLGLRHMLGQTLAAAGGWEHHLGYLLCHYVLRMPLWHALVTVPLALRGAWVHHWWGFALGLLCAGWTLRALCARTGCCPGFLLVALPAWFMLGLNAAVAVNQPRYNLMLVPPYCLAAGLGAARNASRHR